MVIQAGNHIKNYLINDPIAEGGMGIVWHAVNLENNEPVAIKVVANDLTFDPDFKVRIRDEARRHLRLKHPNIVSVLDVFETFGDTCIVMELIEGTSLDILLEKKADHRLAPHEAIPIAGDLLDALDYAHRNAIVHRDVKPSNVLIDRNNRALLIDFGIALAIGEERRTRTGQTIGTPIYMSPEQITTPHKITHLSDVYSLGCVLYELLTGRPPFVQGVDGVGDTDYAIQEAHVKMMPVNPRSRMPDIPADLADLIMAAIEKDPNRRIPGCQEFLRLLKDGGKRQGHQDTNGIQATRQTSKTKWLIGILILLLVVFGFILISLNW